VIGLLIAEMRSFLRDQRQPVTRDGLFRTLDDRRHRHRFVKLHDRCTYARTRRAQNACDNTSRPGKASPSMTSTCDHGTWD